MSYNVNLGINIKNKKILNELIKIYLLKFSHETYLINKQVRSCAWLDLPEELVPYAEQALMNLFKSDNIQYYILPFDLMVDNHIYGHIQIFLYRYNWQKQLFIHFINKRNTLIGDFIFGKLLGYSDISINEYFLKNNIKDLEKCDVNYCN